MCSICGIVFNSSNMDISFSTASSLQGLMKEAISRGKDSMGWSIMLHGGENKYSNLIFKYPNPQKGIENLPLDIKAVNLYLERNHVTPLSLICNFRAEPTVERVKVKDDFTIQPCCSETFGILVHNGTVPNDVEILKNNPQIAMSLNWSSELEESHGKLIDSYSLLYNFKNFSETEDPKFLEDIQGGFAVAYQDLSNGKTILARNFRGLATVTDKYSNVWFASKKEFLEPMEFYQKAEDLEPFSQRTFLPEWAFPHKESSFLSLKQNNDIAVVVCSGGLDSTTVATYACYRHKEVILLHFHYGCLAEKAESKAIIKIVDYLNRVIKRAQVSYKFIELSWLKNLGGSVLTEESRHNEIAKGDEGVETLNAWVSARNLVMMSLAASYCDRYNISNIYLGSNLEEGSVFPDNTSSFTESFEYCMNFGTLSRPKVITPLSNKMKKDIVKLAFELKAPVHLSWSCYHDTLCSSIEEECGPCRMKRIALEENGLTLNEFKEFDV